MLISLLLDAFLDIAFLQAMAWIDADSIDSVTQYVLLLQNVSLNATHAGA